MSGDLAAFLAARLDDDKQVAKGLEGATRFIGSEPDFYGVGGPAAAAFWGHFTPARVLRDVAAKRATLAAYEEALWMQAGFKEVSAEEAARAALETVCRHLAAAYSGHPGYDPAWAPSGSPVPDRHHEDEQQQQAHGSGHGRPI